MKCPLCGKQKGALPLWCALDPKSPPKEWKGCNYGVACDSCASELNLINPLARLLSGAIEQSESKHSRRRSTRRRAR